MKFTYWSLKNKKTGNLVKAGTNPILFTGRSAARARRRDTQTVVKVETLLKLAA